MTEDVFSFGSGSDLLVAGDSLVAGEGAKDDFGWAQRMARDRRADILAVCGVTSTGLFAHLPPARYDRVVFQIGTNDARFRHQRNATETEPLQLRANLEELTRHFRASGRDPRFYFVDTLFVDETRSVLFKADRSYFSKDIEHVSHILKAFCFELGHTYISLRQVGRDRSRLTDGLHPNDAIHDEIYRIVRETITPSGDGARADTV